MYVLHVLIPWTFSAGPVLLLWTLDPCPAEVNIDDWMSQMGISWEYMEQYVIILKHMMGLRVSHVVFNMSFFLIICNVRSFPKKWGYPFVIIQSPWPRRSKLKLPWYPWWFPNGLFLLFLSCYIRKRNPNNYSDIYSSYIMLYSHIFPLYIVIFPFNGKLKTGLWQCSCWSLQKTEQLWLLSARTWPFVRISLVLS